MGPGFFSDLESPGLPSDPSHQSSLQVQGGRPKFFGLVLWGPRDTCAALLHLVARWLLAAIHLWFCVSSLAAGPSFWHLFVLALDTVSRLACVLKETKKLGRKLLPRLITCESLDT